MNYRKRAAAFFLTAAAALFLCGGCGKNVPAAVSSASVTGKGELSSASSKTAAPSSMPAVSQAVSEPPEASPSVLDGAVFIGDSITLKLKNYVTLKRRADPSFFGKARFLAAGSMGSGNALLPVGEDSIHPLYNGKKEALEDSLADMGAEKVYLMLGANDLAPYGVKGAAEKLETLADRFLAKLPSLQIYIQSATPLLPEKQMRTLNNKNLAEYDAALSALCAGRGWNYLDVTSVMRAQDGSLRREYCSDPDDLGMHFTDEACGAWIHFILTHTENGTEATQ